MSYKFRKIGKFLICLEQPLLAATKTLLLDASKNNLRSIGFSRANAYAALKSIAKHKVSPAEGVMSFPVFGQLGIKVHNGHKLFDFDLSEVSKVFDEAYAIEDARTEIDASRTASAVSAAPRHVMADSKFGWLTESLIAGSHATQLVSLKSSDYLRYYQDVENCLLDLVQCQESVSIAASAHVDGLMNNGFRRRWLGAGIDSSKIDSVTEYLRRQGSWLLGNSDESDLQLVLTHGDFSLVNAIQTNRGLRFIDWEGIGFGGLYSDLFNFVFVERYYERTSDKFVAELSAFLQTYRYEVRHRHPELAIAANLDATFARQLYYLERLSLLLDREVSANLVEVVMKTIDQFASADLEIGDVDSKPDG